MSKLFLSMLLLCSSVAVAQRLDKFKLNVAAGYATPTNRTDRNGNKDAGQGGFVYSLEPQYRVTKHLDIGLRFEQAFIQRPEVLENSVYFDTQAKSILSGALTVNYSVGNTAAFRPYIGAGGGFYTASKSEHQVLGAGNTILYYPLPATNKLGAFIRAGVQIWQFNVEFAYNYADNTTVQNDFTNAILRGNNKYFSVKAGYTLGGRYHKS